MTPPSVYLRQDYPAHSGMLRLPGKELSGEVVLGTSSQDDVFTTSDGSKAKTALITPEEPLLVTVSSARR